MSEAKFTRGPWVVYGQQKISNGKRLIALAQGRFEVNNGLDENVANAHLIAAAPKMYAALEPFALFACSPPGECQCNNCIARDVLTEARGETTTGSQQ